MTIDHITVFMGGRNGIRGKGTHEDIYQEFTCRIRLYSNYYDIRRDTTINDFCIRSQPYTVDYVCFVYDCVPSIFV